MIVELYSNIIEVRRYTTKDSLCSIFESGSTSHFEINQLQVKRLNLLQNQFASVFTSFHPKDNTKGIHINFFSPVTRITDLQYSFFYTNQILFGTRYLIKMIQNFVTSKILTRTNQSKWIRGNHSCWFVETSHCTLLVCWAYQNERFSNIQYTLNPMTSPTDGVRFLWFQQGTTTSTILTVFSVFSPSNRLVPRVRQLNEAKTILALLLLLG